jgi:WD40 repeat protein
VPRDENRALLYDARTGALTKVLGGKDACFKNVALSPDGARVVSLEDSCFDHPEVLAFWDVASAKIVTRLPVDIDVSSGTIEFSPDGSRLIMVLAGLQGTQLRDSATGALIRAFADEQSLRFSPSGRRVLGDGGKDNVPHIYDAASGRQLSVLGSRSSSLRHGDAAFLDDQHVVTVDAEMFQGKCQLWEIDGPRLEAEFTMGNIDLGHIAVSPDGRLLALTAEMNNTVGIWDLSSHTKILDLHGHSDKVSAAAFTGNGQALVTGSQDGTVRVYPAEEFAPIRDLVDRARTTVSRQLSESDVRDLFTQ